MEKYKIVFHSLEQIQEFVKWAEKISCQMDISVDSIIVDGKSLAGIAAIGLEREILLTVHGKLSDTVKITVPIKLMD